MRFVHLRMKEMHSKIDAKEKKMRERMWYIDWLVKVVFAVGTAKC